MVVLKCVQSCTINKDQLQVVVMLEHIQTCIINKAISRATIIW